MARIVIIGGGVAGLSAGILGELSGHEVTVLERHTVAGGNLTGWRRGGFTIDNCVHWLTGTNPNTETYKLWEELSVLGGGVEIIKPETLYTFSLGGEEISLCRDLDKLKDRMLSVSPEDRSETEAFVRAVRAVQGVSGIRGASHGARATIGELLRASPALLKYFRISTAELSERFKHPLLSGFMRALLGDCFGAIALVFVFAHFTGENADLPRGGSMGMAERMVKRFTSLGGELITGARVKRIRHTRGVADAAILADGGEICADYFILACDPKPAFEELLSLPTPRDLAARYRRGDMHRFSSFNTAFALEGKEIPFGQDLVIKLTEGQRVRLLSEHLVLREFSHEPSFSPYGRSIIQTMSFLGEEACRHFIEMRKRSLTEYRHYKERMARATERVILDRFPELRGRLTLLDAWSPASYERYTGAEVGSYMSFTLPKSFIPTRCRLRIPSLKNVLLSGQWLQPPGGLPTAAELGRAAIREIERMEEKAFKLRTNWSGKRKIRLGEI
ncbi:MAG: NAD(P)/FAD-dependent oxidoreductase [Clostridia bacterium]|nr:NAD(P)/FAD-dependent oxidoreductase [Clostridia bacterium]